MNKNNFNNFVYNVPEISSIRDLCDGSCERFPKNTAFAFRDGDGVREVTYEEVYDDVKAFASYLHSLGLEGKKIAGCGCMTEDMEKAFFGHNAVFIMDPLDDSNRPVPGLHTNVIRRWGLFPKSMEKLFIQAFSKQSILFPEKRVIDREWMTLMIQLRSMLCKCPHCGEETFVEPDSSNQVCLDCGRNIEKPMVLKVDKFRIPLFQGQKIYNVQLPVDGDLNAIVGEVVRHSMTNRLGIKNYSTFTWQAIDPAGDVHNVSPEAGMPIKNEMKIKFKMGINGLIVK